MEHSFNLKQVYFDLIKQKIKIYEIRLYDEKRKLLSVGDQLNFIASESGETIKTTITELIFFSSFKEMIKSLNSKDIGFENKTDEEIFSTYRQFYSSEQEQKYGVLAIKVEV